MSRFYIYALFDSACPDVIGYVGCSQVPGRRFDSHRLGRDKSTKKWVSECTGNVRLIILESVRANKAALSESRWITSLRPACNLNGYVFTRLIPEVEQVVKPRLYWEEENRHFVNFPEAANYFGVSSGCIYAGLRNGNGRFFARGLSRYVTLEKL